MAHFILPEGDWWDDYNPYDEEEIRQGILKLIDDQHLREELIKNGLENAKKYHGPQSTSQIHDR